MKRISIFILFMVFFWSCTTETKETYKECPDIELVFSFNTASPAGTMYGRSSIYYAFWYKGRDTINQQLKFVIDNEGAYSNRSWKDTMSVWIPTLGANEGMFIDQLSPTVTFENFETPKILQISELSSPCYVKLSSSFQYCRFFPECNSQFRSILKADYSDKVYLLLKGKWYQIPVDGIQSILDFGANS